MADRNPNFPAGPYPLGEHFVPPPRPSSPVTAEWSLNHLMIRISDPEKSLKFYCDMMGLHVLFIVNVGPFTLYYLGPRDTSIENATNSKGLLELYHIPADTESNTTYTDGNNYSIPGGVGFGHIGFTVPDVPAALARARSFGYEVIKPLGEAEENQMAMPPAIAEGKYGPAAEGYKHIFRQLAFVKDPDGYWVEFVPKKFKE